MAQVFDRSSNALARFSLVLTGLIVISLGVALDQLQRSPWVTKQGQRAGPAGPVQPQAPRRRFGSAVPVLPCAGGEGCLRRNSSDQNMCQLPFTDLDKCRVPGAGATELGDGRIDPVDPGA